MKIFNKNIEASLLKKIILSCSAVLVIVMLIILGCLKKNSNDGSNETKDSSKNVTEDVSKESEKLTEWTMEEDDTTTEVPTEPPTEVPTEPPTEAPTEPPTEPPTETPTESPTQAVVVTPENFRADIFNDKYISNTMKINHPEFDISDELKNEFSAVLSLNPENIRFYAISIDEKISFGYNPDDVYFAACTVKAGYVMNIYKQVELGNVDLNAIMTYEEGMYHGGSGIIKDGPYGKSYTIQELLDYSLIYSDNVAYNMIRDMKNRSYVQSYDAMIGEFGCTSTRLGGRNWANTTARDMVKIMRQIYYYGQESTYGQYLIETLKNTQWNYFKELMPEYDCAAKIGYVEGTCSMVGIVYGEIPYILCVSAAREDEELKPVITLCNKVMNEYIQYQKK